MSQTQPEDFIPSAKSAKYDGHFIPTDTPGPLYIEDDQLNTEWYNPTSQDVVLEIHIGTDPKNAAWRKAYLEASPARRLEMKSGNRIYVIKAGQIKMVPSDYDLAVQRTHCLHPACTSKKDACKDLDHPRVVSAGLAPQLICKRWHRVPGLAANLDMAKAQAEQAMTAMAKANVEKLAADMEVQGARKLLEEAQRATREALEAKARAEEAAARESKARLEAENKLQAAEQAARKKGT